MSSPSKEHAEGGVTDADPPTPAAMATSAPKEDSSDTVVALVEDTDDDSLSNEDDNNKGEKANNSDAADDADSFGDERFLSTVVEEEDYCEDEDPHKDSIEPPDDDPLPLFQYSRLTGSLPRSERTQQASSPPFSVALTSTVIGKVVLSSDTTLSSEQTTDAQQSLNTASPTESNNRETAAAAHVPTELWQQQPIPIAAYGFQDGQVWLVDALTGMAVAGPDQLPVREGDRTRNNNRHAIVGLSLDASGTYLAALDDAGMCAIFELKFAIQMQSTGRRSAATATRRGTASAPGNVFTNFISAWTGGSGGNQNRNDNVLPERNNNNNNATNDDSAESELEDDLVPTLTLASIQVQRISYPSSFGKSTCLALDPSYRRKREKSFMVGFADGKLILTKRGFVFQRRNDAVLYQAVKDDPKNFFGIEAITWRGSLVAWADSSGVRLLDSDALQRIAHVDRPSGARPSLYPSVSQVRPTLCFETSNHLLVAWGDCLLTLQVRETTTAPTTLLAPSGSSTGTSELPQAAGSTSGGGPVMRRRHVECTMAWELDCIACGVAPLDAKHVVVLGLVPPTDSETGDPASEGHNHVELQVVSRVDGNVVFADTLPLVRAHEPARRRGRVPLDSTASFQLMSSFAVPRMDNASELQEKDGKYGAPSIFSGGGINGVFCDSHLAWGLDKIVFEDDDLLQNSRARQKGDSDAGSCDSDDYSFALNPIPDSSRESEGTILPSPPIMIVASAADAVLARTRDIDDAVSSALESKRPALALHRALQHMRQLRRYRIKDLVNEYLRALLRLDNDRGTGKRKALSMRRMKLAAQAIPVLLGGDVAAWEHWISELKKLPGALFVVRNSLPVRDPKLRKEVYAKMLSTMLEQVEEMKESSYTDESRRLVAEVEDQFLNTLLAWGTTHALSDFADLLKYQSEIDDSYKTSFETVVASLGRRSKQTAAVYLSFQPTLSSIDSSEVGSIIGPTDTKDALFDIADIARIFVSRLAKYLQHLSQDLPKDSVAVVPVDGVLNSSVALDAGAKLSMMKGRYSDALVYYLAIGALQSPRTIGDVEAFALSSVSRLEGDLSVSPSEKQSKYAYVIRLIEKHHLHQCILDSHFLPEELDMPPLFALAKLVGLEMLGQFLLAHCVSPQSNALPELTVSPSRRGGDDRRGTLPLDIVAMQLEASPQLLHWYLHLLFIHKPGLYVRFPDTTIPPSIIAALHRKHLDLHIKYAGVNRDSTKVLKGVETYRVASRKTPLLSFLQEVLLLGGISPVEVGKMLEVERRGGSGVSKTFALELAYIMERYGNDTIDDATLVLELYLKGAESLVLAVSFAERSKQHSATLWQSLIEFCLGSVSDKTGDSSPKKDGALFGSLLEAAALSGSDLANLVKQIPHGMAVQGLRPRLVAAVGDYRHKLQMHDYASAIAITEKIDLLREISHRSRRGMLYDIRMKPELRSLEMPADKTGSHHAETRVLSQRLRTRERQDRHSLAYSIPIR